MIKRIKRGWMKLQVESITQETPDTVTLHFVDADEGGRQFDYIAGQYLTFRFDNLSEKPVVRSYTMSSSPTEDVKTIDVTVKEVADPFISKYLTQTVRVGDILRARGPIGRFGYQASVDHPHLVMTAGGSGVTPFLSLMREHSKTLGQKGSPDTMTLIASFRTQEDIICKKQLEDLNQVHGVHIYITLSREDAIDKGYLKGRIDATLLEKTCSSEYKNSTFMTCGPEAIMNTTVEFLKKIGVDSAHIKTESFN
ncbi:MAG: ferredoxin--NADP reductase [Oligoflexales bacterium]